MLTDSHVKETSNGDLAAAATVWPPEALRPVAGDLPLDEVEEVALAMETCQALDDDAMETLAGLDLQGEALAAVEQLAYSAAIRRYYVARLGTMPGRVTVAIGDSETS